MKQKSTSRFTVSIRSAMTAIFKVMISAVAALIAMRGTATAQQTLYEADSLSGNIIAISSGGTQSNYATGLINAQDLAFDSSLNLYVSQTVASGYGGTIYEITPAGTQSVFTGYPYIDEPTALAFASNGNLFESDYGFGYIHSITPSGNASIFAGEYATTNPAGMAFNNSGDLFVANSGSNSISEFTPAGVESTFVSGLQGPFGLAFDASGNLYASIYNNGNGTTVVKITPGGVVSTFATGLLGPTGLAFDKNGNLFVSNYDAGTMGAGTITEVTPGGVESIYAAGLDGPVGLAFGPLVVPEPSTWALLGLGVLAGGLCVRRGGRTPGEPA